MAKSTTPYWNPLAADVDDRWSPVEGFDGMADELTLSLDPVTGEYTRLTRFRPGADTTPFGGKRHDYPEEVFIVSPAPDDPVDAHVGMPEPGIVPGSRPIRGRCLLSGMGTRG